MGCSKYLPPRESKDLFLKKTWILKAELGAKNEMNENKVALQSLFSPRKTVDRVQI